MKPNGTQQGANTMEATALDSGHLEALLRSATSVAYPIFGLAARMPRDIHAQAVEALLSVIAIYFGSGIIGTPIVFMALNRLMLRRVSQISRELALISFGNRESIAVAIVGDDDITETAQAINQMVSRLNTAHIRLQQSEGQFRMLTEPATVGIYLTNTDGGLLLVNGYYTLLSGLDGGANLGDGWLNAVIPRIAIASERRGTARYRATQTSAPNTVSSNRRVPLSGLIMSPTRSSMANTR